MPTELYLDLCAIITMIMLIVSLNIRKQTKGRSNRLFFALCFCVLITGISGMAGSLVGNLIPLSSIRRSTAYFIHYIYFYLWNFTPPLYLLYVCSQIGLWHVTTHNKLIRFFWFFPYLADAVLLLINPWTHFVFTLDAQLKYQRGPYIPVLYLNAFFYFMLGTWILLHYRKLMDQIKLLFLFLFLPINAFAVVMQYLSPGIHIEIMSTVLLLLIVAIGVQRPEEMVDPIVGTMSNNAFLLDMRQAFLSKRPMSVLFINFTNHAMLRNNLGIFLYHVLLQRLADKTTRISRIMQLHPDIYYLDNGSFAVITDDKHHESLLDLGRMIHAYMQEPVKLDHMEIMVNTAICLVKCPYDISDHSVFISFSRNFQNKLPNLNRVVVFSNIASSKEFMLRNQIDNVINKGIANRKFEMYYQPIYSLAEKRFVSAEALIRLKDEDFGYVSPSIFISAAEESGAIHRIGNYVFDEVCRFIAGSEFHALGLKYIELNLSLSQCIERDLPEKVLGYLQKYNLSPGQLNLEITETAADYDPSTTDANISKLAAYGIPFSLDDYGTGYSNIKRVASLPLSIVKLDKSLVDEMDSHQMWIVVKNTVRMLQRMQKKILVEGVETERALQKFEQIGCDYIQGFYFSRPLNERDFIDFIKKHNHR